MRRPTNTVAGPSGPSTSFRITLADTPMRTAASGTVSSGVAIDNSMDNCTHMSCMTILPQFKPIVLKRLGLSGNLSNTGRAKRQRRLDVACMANATDKWGNTASNRAYSDMARGGAVVALDGGGGGSAGWCWWWC
jgi:hypothetical protein